MSVKEQREKYKVFGPFIMCLLFGFIIGILVCIIPVVGPFIGVFIIVITPFIGISTVKDINKEIAYNNNLIGITIPKDAIIVNVISGANLVNCYDNYLWKDKNSLCFFAKSYDKFNKEQIEKYFTLIELPLENIDFYNSKGDIYTETKVSGGGGGGISVGGALVGHAIAGTAGAVIAGRKKTNEVTSETIIHDERTTDVYYKKDNKLHIIKLNFSDYDKLLSLIPEKSYEYQLLNKH